MMPASLCPHCCRPLPTSLLGAVLHLAGDPALDSAAQSFVENMRMILLRGLDLGPAHRERLLELYHQRHELNFRVCRGRARLAEDL